ncbi:MAG: methylenetetrahydrofolate reductase C-terminal domain-containing protein [Thermodesulfobacteriota bacterium]
MIVAKPKEFSEIVDMVRDCTRVLVAGCGTCVAVCLAGGEKEASIMATRLQLVLGRDNENFEAFAATVERQCDREFLNLFEDQVRRADAVVSLACGAGIQFLSDVYPDTPVFPGVDTSFIGVAEGAGIWTERCRSCNQCYLGITGGICPVTMCAKSLLNGPCGGPQDGKCETAPDRDCAWVKIIERLERQSRLDILKDFVPPRRHDLSSHPAKIQRQDYQERMGRE